MRGGRAFPAGRQGEEGGSVPMTSKRLVRAILGVTVATMTLLPPTYATGQQRTPVPRFYRGETSAGGGIYLRTLQQEHVRRVWLDARLVAECEDGATFVVHGGWLDGRRLDEQGSFALHRASPPGAPEATILDLAGAVHARGAEGTLSVRYVSLDANEEPQWCSTGDLTWTAQRQGP
jgi:hypothetical protein